MAETKKEFDPKTAEIHQWQKDYMKENGIDGSKCKTYDDALKLIMESPASNKTIARALSRGLGKGQDRPFTKMTEGEVRDIIRQDREKPVTKWMKDALAKIGVAEVSNMTKGQAYRFFDAHRIKTDPLPVTDGQKRVIVMKKLEDVAGKPIVTQSDFRAALRKYNDLPLENEKMKVVLAHFLKDYTRKDGTKVTVDDQLSKMTRGQASILYDRHKEDIDKLPLSEGQKKALKSYGFSDAQIEEMNRGEASANIAALSVPKRDSYKSKTPKEIEPEMTDDEALSVINEEQTFADIEDPGIPF